MNNWDKARRSFERGVLPTVEMGGKLTMEADEVGHMTVPESRYGWRVGSLYITSKRVCFEYGGSWANWFVKHIICCKLEDSGFVFDLRDRRDVPHISTGDPSCDRLAVAIIQKLISVQRAHPAQPKGGYPDRQSPRTDSPAGKGGAQRVRGEVKWFNNDKGYGFITTQNGLDIFVHYSSVLGEGFKSLQEGDPVEFEIVQGTHGPMAMRITKLGQSSTGSASENAARSQSTPQSKGVPPNRPYEILGVSPGATLDEITRAYHREAQMNHPDKVATMAPEFRELAERRMKELNAAFNELRNRVK